VGGWVAGCVESSLNQLLLLTFNSSSALRFSRISVLSARSSAMSTLEEIRAQIHENNESAILYFSAISELQASMPIRTQSDSITKYQKHQPNAFSGGKTLMLIGIVVKIYHELQLQKAYALIVENTCMTHLD
jgi:hypothetical protein